MGRKAIWGLVAFAVLLGLAGLGTLTSHKSAIVEPRTDDSHTSHPSQQGLTVAKLLLLDDFRSYLLGKRVVGSWGDLFPVDERTTARALYQQYAANEAAADDKFKGRAIAIKGVIRTVGKDVLGKTYILLDDGNPILGVQAFVADNMLEVAKKLEPDHSLDLVCRGGGMIITIPTLKECQTVDVITQSNKDAIDEIVNNVMSNSGNDVDNSEKLVIGIGYATGSELSAADTCNEASLNAMGDCLAALAKVPKEQRNRDYDRLAKEISLPPRPQDN